MPSLSVDSKSLQLTPSTAFPLLPISWISTLKLKNLAKLCSATLPLFQRVRAGCLAGVLDLCTRRLIGWAMADSNDRHLVLEALHMALRRQTPLSNALFHTDRGSPYACYEFQEQLLAYELTASMSRSGNCYDNAPMESFFHTLKTEFVHHEKFATRAEARVRIFEWIEVFYNRQRLHSSLGYKTPVAYLEEMMLETA